MTTPLAKLARGLICSLLIVSLAFTGLFGAAAAESEAYAGVTKEIVPLERNGVSLYLAKYSSPDEGAKKPVLLVHGLTFSSHEFDVNVGDYSFARYLASNGYVVYALDIAGYGNSGDVDDGYMPDSDYAAEDINAAVDKIIEENGSTTVDVLGWSWGTVTSSRFAAKYPDKIGRLALYAPILYGFGFPEGTVSDPFKVTSYEGAAEDFQMAEGSRIDYSITEEIVALYYIANCWLNDPISPNGGRRDLLETPADTLLIPIGDIKCPTLLIFGDRDPYVNVDVAISEGGKLPEGSVTSVIEGAAHPVMMEKPFYASFREQVTAFLAD
ncbi:MAG: alpha/beta hydrolase [Oscillospiraceae bacterium]|jgi:pimeloyl-ACP methyl ester carboxylesterase|nr:alpha/beta hydrolase [Oscillospiraceae bacterium]